MQARAAISVINWTEVLTKLAERGEDPELAAAELQAAGLIGATVNVEPLTDADCIAVARLRSATRQKASRWPIGPAWPSPSA
jgi:ribonuclease VapC